MFTRSTENREAIKKSKPKKVIRSGLWQVNYCPTCGSALFVVFCYCPDCGQKLDYGKKVK